MKDTYIPSSIIDRNQRMFTNNEYYFFSLILKIQGNIDTHRLETAAAKVAEAIPILRYYYSGNLDKSGWKPLPNNPVWVTCSSAEPAALYTLLKSLPTEHSPIHIVLDKKPDSDTLVISMDHTVTDAHGLLEIAGMISSTYAALGWNPDFSLLPIPQSKDRSLKPLIQSYSHEVCESLCRAEAENRFAVMPYQKLFVTAPTERLSPELFTRQIKPQMFLAMKSFAKQHHATINDVLLTVYAAALKEYAGTKSDVSIRHIPIRSAVDLRKYYPPYLRNEIRNYSVPYWTSVAMPGNDIPSILRGVAASSRKTKAGAPGIGAMFSIEEPDCPVSRPYQDADYSLAPFISNVGVLAKDIVDFGDGLSVKDVVIYANITTENPFIIGVLTWENTLSLCIFTDCNYDIVKRLLDRMTALIEENCQG
jgi:NRPS condensation-like uncharacterized protein